jgi:hypothetical protein
MFQSCQSRMLGSDPWAGWVHLEPGVGNGAAPQEGIPPSSVADVVGTLSPAPQQQPPQEPRSWTAERKRPHGPRMVESSDTDTEEIDEDASRDPRSCTVRDRGLEARQPVDAPSVNMVRLLIVEQHRREMTLACAWHVRAGAGSAFRRNGLGSAVGRTIAQMLRLGDCDVWYRFERDCVYAVCATDRHSICSLPDMHRICSLPDTVSARPMVSDPERNHDGRRGQPRVVRRREFTIGDTPIETRFCTVHRGRLRVFLPPLLSGTILEYAPAADEWTYVENAFKSANADCVYAAMQFSANTGIPAVSSKGRYTIGGPEITTGPGSCPSIAPIACGEVGPYDQFRIFCPKCHF